MYAFHAKHLFLVAMIALAVCCAACSSSAPPAAFPEPSTPLEPSVYAEGSKGVIKSSRTPHAEVNARARELLDEYDIQYGQFVRFSHEGAIYIGYGAYPLTSLEEARTQYPHVAIPEKLGDYQFQDLSIYAVHARRVDSSAEPPSTEFVTVLTDEDVPIKHYLCYQNASIHFRIDLWPVYLEDTAQDFDFLRLDSEPWPPHPDVYVQTTDDGMRLHSMLIPPIQPGGYGFFVQKMVSTDCMENERGEFSEQEALSIYDAICKDFPLPPT